MTSTYCDIDENRMSETEITYKEAVNLKSVELTMSSSCQCETHPSYSTVPISMASKYYVFLVRHRLTRLDST